MTPSQIIAVITATAALASATYPPACTTVLIPSLACCAGPAGHTETSYIDCEGCVLSTPYPTKCDLVRCASPTTTAIDQTTTVTACSASVTPSIETLVRRQKDEDQTITLNDPTCVTLATKTTPGCQDCGATAFPTTQISSVDCAGCALQTIDFEIPGPCVCATATTMMEWMASPTIY